MMQRLRLALLADGPSDRALLHVVRWVLVQHGVVELAAPGFEHRSAREEMVAEMQRTIDLHQPDILFVHRDAEGVDPERRRQEIPTCDGRLVRVVPVRMTEAWLLFDESAIRRAAGNPAGKAAIALPKLTRVEALADPKSTLHDALLSAAAVAGRRRKQMRSALSMHVQRVAELIVDYAPLRALPAFVRFEADCGAALAAR